jgi:hypothetical protein
MLHILEHITGLTGNGNWYALWSGIGSDLGELTIVLVVWRKVNCHAKHCWRIGLHHVDRTHYVTCARHHPVHDGRRPATAKQIAADHAKQQRRAAP